jgi:hypothetical protein
MAGDVLDIVEETFENMPTGVEADTGEGEVEITRPWNPDAIRVGTKQFSLRNILDLIDDGDLELAPDFQRNRVWKERQKSRLIESVLLQIPLPAFYFAEDSGGMMRVVDGLQRLSTVHTYVRNPVSFPLTDLEYLHSASGQRFGELPVALQRRINNTQIVVHVIDPTTPPSVKYDIFKRINTGGSPLNAQEIRHCMSKDRSREFLKHCTQADEFSQATGGSLLNHIRMDDREVALRFCAFWLGGLRGYEKSGSMDSFLEEATSKLDDPQDVSDGDLEKLYTAFCSSMAKCYALFGEHAFRKWPWAARSRSPINRPLFDCWSFVIGRYEDADLERRKDAIVKAARDLMTDNRDYIDAITASTNTLSKVRRRFDLTGQAAGAGL